MKKQYIQPEIELNASELSKFMEGAASWGQDGDTTPIVDDDDPDEIFSKERKSNYSLW